MLRQFSGLLFPDIATAVGANLGVDLVSFPVKLTVVQIQLFVWFAVVSIRTCIRDSAGSRVYSSSGYNRRRECGCYERLQEVMECELM
jgi:hypothetical protein